MSLTLLGCQEQSADIVPKGDLPRPPNIIVIFSDDQGFADLGVHGVDDDIRTPHLDAMAAAGVLCTRGYVTAPQCVPSRAGLITGRYQQRFGVDDNRTGPLPLEEQTLAELLRPAGYITGQVGKWHLEQLSNTRSPDDLEANKPSESTSALRGRHDPFLPQAQGFDEYFCGPMTNYVASHDLGGQPLRDAPEVVTETDFRVEVQTQAALSFIRRHANEPFFLYLAYFTPHVPLESPEPYFSQTSTDLPLERRQALAMTAAMDEGVGSIRALLRAKGIEQDTLLLFISDNGAPLLRGAWNGSLNTPLVGEKGMLTDGGVRVPYLLEWPGQLPEGNAYDHPVTTLDVAASALAAAGLPAHEHLDGVNLLPFLDGSRPEPPHDTLFWRWRSQAAVLHDGWKLIRLGDQQRFLFDLGSPEGEQRNRLEEAPQRAAELEGKLQLWSEGLLTPGLPSEVNPRDARFFESLVDQRSD